MFILPLNRLTAILKISPSRSFSTFALMFELWVFDPKPLLLVLCWLILLQLFEDLLKHHFIRVRVNEVLVNILIFLCADYITLFMLVADF